LKSSLFLFVVALVDCAIIHRVGSVGRVAEVAIKGMAKPMQKDERRGK
jgi:hypothetical protein